MPGGSQASTQGTVGSPTSQSQNPSAATTSSGGISSAEIVSGGGGILSNIMRAIGIQEQAKSQERAGKLTQILFERQAKHVRAASQREAARQRKLGKKVASRGRAVAGASGLQISGSVEDVLAQTREESEKAALEEEFRGEEESFGLRTEGSFARFKGRQAKRQANIAESGIFATNLMTSMKMGFGGG